MRGVYLTDYVDLILQAKLIGREVAKVVPKAETLEPPRITPFPNPYQSKTVDVGGDETVYYEKIPEGMVGYIQLLGNNAFDEVYLYWYVDGQLKITPYVNWQIASVNTPKRIEPWIPVRDEVKWQGKNKSSIACLIEVLCDGFYCPVEDVKILMQLGLPVSR